MNLVLFDDPLIRQHLLPFTFTRPVAEIRTGILTIREKWEAYLKQPASHLTVDYLSEKYPETKDTDTIFINGAICPDPTFVKAVRSLQKGESLTKDDLVLALRADHFAATGLAKKDYPADVTVIRQLWNIFQYNGAQLRADFQLITQGRKSQPLTDPHTRVYAPENIFIEEGASVLASVLNASLGPIYLGKNSQVQEGVLVRGAFALGENSIVNMGAKVRGDVSVGPHSKIGGEISTTVIFGYSNKAHDGFLGSSVIGEWCNLGADTNTSNLKNNYDNVKLWSYVKQGFQSTGLMFCGLMMGDHSKCGINTMFNSGTVTGVSSNIFGDGYPRNFIPSFGWGGAAGFSTFQLEKACVTAAKAMERRNQVLTEADKKILSHIFDMTAHERVWEKKP
ncbi:MAG: GlmU family protein [Cyclobacteriaceae bacterium]|nr:GlmU family protein [Cyclobacteriaceae bacterium]